MPENVSDLSVGLQVASQIPLNFRKHAISQAVLADLGDDNNLAYTYHKGMPFYCALENSRWIWNDSNVVPEGSQRLMGEHFTYPDNVIVNGIDYSNKNYNFYKITNITEENIENFVTVGEQGVGIQTITYNPATGIMTITLTDAQVFATEDLRGADGNDGSNGEDGNDGSNGEDGNSPEMYVNSNTSRTIVSTGVISFTYPSTLNLGLTNGMRVRISNNTSIYMEGVIESIGPAMMFVNIDRSAGSGTHAFWVIGIAGDPGTLPDNLQKTITYPGDFDGDNYDLVEADLNYTIYVDNGATPVTITVGTLPNKFIAAFIQRGTGTITFVEDGITMKSPTGGLKIKGRFYAVAVEQQEASGDIHLLGNTKI